MARHAPDWIQLRQGEQVEVSIWSYLYGNDRAAAAKHDEPLWQRWLTERGITTV